MFFNILLYLHIAAGFTALVSGGVAFSATKGQKLHNTAGKLYVLAMLGVGCSAFTICLIENNPFLFTIGLFSTYMALSGYRSLLYYRRKTSPNLLLDWLIWLPTLLLAVGFTGYMIVDEGLHLSGMQPVLLVFMGILLSMLTNDLRLFRNLDKVTKTKLLQRHISRMCGAYISTITAFMVTNVHTQPAFLVWLLPTAIGIPFMVYFIRKYSPKTKKVRQVI